MDKKISSSSSRVNVTSTPVVEKKEERKIYDKKVSVLSRVKANYHFYSKQENKKWMAVLKTLYNYTVAPLIRRTRYVSPFFDKFYDVTPQLTKQQQKQAKDELKNACSNQGVHALYYNDHQDANGVFVFGAQKKEKKHLLQEISGMQNGAVDSFDEHRSKYTIEDGKNNEEMIDLFHMADIAEDEEDMDWLDTIEQMVMPTLKPDIQDWPLKVKNSRVCICCMPLTMSFGNKFALRDIFSIVRHLPKNSEGYPDISRLRIVFTDIDQCSKEFIRARKGVWNEDVQKQLILHIENIKKKWNQIIQQEIQANFSVDMKMEQCELFLPEQNSLSLPGTAKNIRQEILKTPPNDHNR